MLGCSKDEKTVNIDFPFAIEDIENIQMYHYVGVPVSAEKKVVVADENIKTLYDTFDDLPLEDKEIEEIAGQEEISFRFKLSDGTNYELVYVAHGVKKGSLKSSTGGFEYFTSADIIWYWSNLNRELESVPVDEAELPK